MRVVPDWREMNIVLRVVLISGFIGFSLAMVFIACEDEYYFGKSREELAREFFVVDSLLQQLQLDLGDSSSLDFERFYINAQRINQGHD